MLSKRKLVRVCLLLKLKQIIINNEKQKSKKVAKRKYWVKPLLITRCDSSIEASLLKDLLWEEDVEDFNKFRQFNITQFEEILSRVESRIKKNDTQMRAAIPARTKLAITLRYLATGDSYSSLEFLSRVSKSAISNCIPIVARAICDSLKSDFLKVPASEEEWMAIANDFQDIWHFPHVLGALDGKHIHIKAPPNSGLQFYNCKGFHSIVLFAAVDAHCRFIFVDIGSNGKSCESTIYRDSFIYDSLENGTLNVPKNKELIPGRGDRIPYFFIGDDTFPLDRNIMTPFSRCSKLNTDQEVFNYRLCRARMTAEGAFGRLAKRFGIYCKTIEVNISTLDSIVMATCVLHNFLTKKKDQPLTPHITLNNENISTTFSPIMQQTSNPCKYANCIRDDLCRYFVTDGNVDFQWKMLNIQQD